MKTLGHLLTSTWLIAMRSVGARAGTIDGFCESVVFLNHNEPLIETLNGVQYEVWLKIPGSNVLTAKIIQKAGSGLIVISSGMAYLATAKHVAMDLTEDFEIIMRGGHREPLHLSLVSLTGQPTVRWYHHPQADVSVHPLPTITRQGLDALRGRSIPLAILEAGTNQPSRDVPLTALGFPLRLGAEGEFMPLSRETKASSGMLSDAAGYFFLLQDPSVSGYSGGPLIESPGLRFTEDGGITPAHPHCWGFVSATYGDETGGKMCRITPAFYVVQLIQKIEREVHVEQVLVQDTTVK